MKTLTEQEFLSCADELLVDIFSNYSSHIYNRLLYGYSIFITHKKPGRFIYELNYKFHEYSTIHRVRIYVYNSNPISRRFKLTIVSVSGWLSGTEKPISLTEKQSKILWKYYESQ